MRERPRRSSRRTDHRPIEPHDQASRAGPNPGDHAGRLWEMIRPRDHAPAVAYEDLVRTAEAALEAGQVYEAAVAYLRGAYLATEVGWKQRARKLLGRVTELAQSPRLGKAQRGRLAALMRCSLFGEEPSPDDRNEELSPEVRGEPY